MPRGRGRVPASDWESVHDALKESRRTKRARDALPADAPFEPDEDAANFVAAMANSHESERQRYEQRKECMICWTAAKEVRWILAGLVDVECRHAVCRTCADAEIRRAYKRQRNLLPGGGYVYPHLPLRCPTCQLAIDPQDPYIAIPGEYDEDFFPPA